MIPGKNTSISSSIKPVFHPGRRVNWHEAAVCAIQIELRDFADILEFHKEYVLGKNNYRIDLLVIKMLSDHLVPKNIARLFKTYNLFEIKGIHSSVTSSAYYKTIGYAALLLDQINNNSDQCSSMDISITFLSFHYPRKLIKYLRKNNNFTIEKYSDGIYYINNETFKIQIIVTRELPPEENLYLCCLTNNLRDISMIKQLADDYAKHQDSEIYNKYLYQLSTANLETKGESFMVNEWLFNLFGTSSEEIAAHAKQESDEYYLPKLNELSAAVEHLSSSNEQLSLSNEQQASFIKQLTSQVNYLEGLLMQNNISFE